MMPWQGSIRTMAEAKPKNVDYHRLVGAALGEPPGRWIALYRDGLVQLPYTEIGRILPVRLASVPLTRAQEGQLWRAKHPRGVVHADARSVLGLPDGHDVVWALGPQPWLVPPPEELPEAQRLATRIGAVSHECVRQWFLHNLEESVA